VPRASAPEHPGSTANPAARSSLSASPTLRVVVPELHSGKIRPMSGDAAPRLPDMSSSVGWKGLLEMSRTSGAAGVVGVQRSVGIDELLHGAHESMHVCVWFLIRHARA